MNETIISVAEAARDFAECVNRAHHRNQTFVLVKDGVPYARLVPVGAPVCHGRDLAEVLASVELPDEEAHAWNQDLQSGRKKLDAPSDKWR